MNAGGGGGSVRRSFRAASQRGGPGLPPAAAPGDLLEIQIFKLLPQLSGIRNSVSGSSDVCFNKPSR